MAQTKFEKDVIAKLATLEERTKGLPQLIEDVSTIKGRVGLVEFKSSVFGVIGGAILVGIKFLFGRSS